MRDARAVIESEEFATKTDLGRGMVDYFEMRDQLEEDMQAKGVSNLDTKVAEGEGFTERYDIAVQGIKAAHPDFERWYDVFDFDKDLRAVRTAGQVALDKLNPDQLDAQTDWEERWEKAKGLPYDEDKIVTEDQKFDAYVTMRNIANSAYAFGAKENPLRLWWGQKDPNEKREYLAGTATRDGIYWSRFDWEVMGLKSTQASTKFWNKIDADRSKAFDQDAVDADFELGKALDKIDKDIAAAAKKNELIAKQVRVMNTWGYGLETMVMGGAKDSEPIATPETRKVWQSFFDGIATIQAYVNKYELDPYDPDDVVWYGSIKNEFFAKYIKELKREHPTFGRQYGYVQNFLNGDTLHGEVLPELDKYFPIGIVGDAKPETQQVQGALAPLMNGQAGNANQYPGFTPAKLAKRGGVKMIAPALKELVQAQKDLDIPVLQNVGGSGFRTHAEQVDAYQRYQAGGNRAAPPGESMHEVGRAVDIDSNFLARNPELISWLDQHGWVNAVPDEPWHWEYQG
jgi:hypothetical protein